ncbi:hypothetical protein Emed_006974 [Eimeria media]
MENLSAGQRPLPEQEEAVESPEGRSVASHHKNTAASDFDPEDSYTIEADKTKAARPFRSRRLAIGALAAVALGLVLATALSKRLPSVETPPPVKAPEDVKEGLPAVGEKVKEPEIPSLAETLGGPKEESQIAEAKPEMS